MFAYPIRGRRPSREIRLSCRNRIARRVTRGVLRGKVAEVECEIVSLMPQSPQIKYNLKYDMRGALPMCRRSENAKLRYTAAYPVGREYMFAPLYGCFEESKAIGGKSHDVSLRVWSRRKSLLRAKSLEVGSRGVVRGHSAKTSFLPCGRSPVM